MTVFAVAGAFAASSAYAGTITTYVCPQVAEADLGSSCTDYNNWLADSLTGGAGNLATETFTSAPLTVAQVVGMDGIGAVDTETWLDTATFGGPNPNTAFSYTGGSTHSIGGYFDLSDKSYGSGLVISIYTEPYNGGSGASTVLSPILYKYADPLVNPVFKFGFFGVTSSMDIYAIEIGTQAPSDSVIGFKEVYRLDNLSFAKGGGGGGEMMTGDVPEPMSFSLFGLGLLGIGFARRFRKR